MSARAERLALVALLGCTPAGAERDVPYAQSAPFGEWTLDTSVVTHGREVVVRGVYAAPVVLGDRAWVAADDGRGDGAIFELVPGGASREVVSGGRPDRLAVGPDGSLAYVSGRSGLASVWLLSPDGTSRLLTNAGLVPTPGRAPEGYTPPPRSAPRFEGEWLRWDGGEVRWR